MTYDQYQQLYGAAKEQIAARVAKVQPRAGNGASVNGMGIAVDVGVAEEDDAVEPTWTFSLIGDFTITRNYSDRPSEVTLLPNQQLASAARTTGAIIAPPYWEQSQVFDIIVPPDDPAPGYTFSRSVKIAFRSSSRDRGDETGFRFPVRAMIEMVQVEQDGTVLDVVNTYTLLLGYSGQTRNFVAPSSDAFFYLSLKSVERVG